MKQLMYRILRYLGVYWIASRFIRHRLFILCYHGISVKDEHQFWPGVFMREAVFRERLELLKSYGFNVLSLSQSLRALDLGAIPPRSIVITADDGYENTPETLWKGCTDYGFPLTIYITSYYAEKQNPIFNVIVYYLFWRTEKAELVGDFSFVGMSSNERLEFSEDEGNIIAQKIIDFGREKCDEDGRASILVRLCELMGFDYNAIKRDGMFMLMDKGRISEIAKQGADIQLHTHRHKLKIDREHVEKEIADNREFLEPAVGEKLNHFCYPSGKWHPEQKAWLKDLGMKSATTCDLGFVTAKTDRLALNRYLDRDDISADEFLAEISGFLMLGRVIRRYIKNAFRSIAQAQ
jgi:peptidoglycan/xylan/chitin deacetylase (PgdA/CDA1 family)